jgi:hypothetical protein
MPDDGERLSLTALSSGAGNQVFPGKDSRFPPYVFGLERDDDFGDPFEGDRVQRCLGYTESEEVVQGTLALFLRGRGQVVPALAIADDVRPAHRRILEATLPVLPIAFEGDWEPGPRCA